MPGVHQGFRHEALFYDGEGDLLDRITAFIGEGVDAGEPALVVLKASRLAALRERLGEPVEGVEFADMNEVGGNPARIIPAWHEFVDRHAAGGRRLRGVGEPIWRERGPEELVECQRHESLLNLAFADAPEFHLLCPYDTADLEPSVLEEARRSHPVVSCAGVDGHSDAYRGLAAVAAPHAEPLPEPPPGAEWCTFDQDGLRAVRELVAGRAADAGFSTEMADDLELAVDEVAANSIVHGGGEGTLGIWRDGMALVCEVSDPGTIDRPLAGRERPVPGQRGGFGLWVANQVCDLVQVRTYPSGNVVRLHMRRARRVPPA